MNDFKLTKKFIKSLIRYEPDTGDLYWTERRQGRRIDAPAGHHHAAGSHVQICIAGKYHPAHHVIWLLVHGTMPDRLHCIKHRNGNRLDNRLENLKLARKTSNQKA